MCRLLRILSLFTTLGVVCLLSACHSNPNEKRIGIIVPIEHQAMNEIVAGFTETLKANYPKAIEFKVSNAQGDLNLERAIIQQMKDEHYDIIAPIGTDLTEMALANIHQQPILSLAASISQADRDREEPCHLAVVHDEIPSAQLINFIHVVYPNLKNLTLIYSTSDKIFPEVKAAIEAGKNVGITVTGMLVPTLNDLYSTANNLPAHTEAIFVLKDNLIVSGISTLAQAAAKHHIPLITSDQGSVQDGAGFALGVHEREIGVEGAKLALAILNGKPICTLPIVEMTKLTVFINPNALHSEQQTLTDIQNAAKKLGYMLEDVNAKKQVKT